MESLPSPLQDPSFANLCLSLGKAGSAHASCKTGNLLPTSHTHWRFRILGSLFYFFPKNKGYDRSKQDAAGGGGAVGISLLTVLFPSCLPTSQVFPSLSISLPITQKFSLVGFTFSTVQFHSTTRKHKMWRGNNILFFIVNNTQLPRSPKRLEAVLTLRLAFKK